MTYQPLCSACRASSKDTFYKACQGCQARRTQALAAWRKKPGMPPLPAPSVNEPDPLSTYGDYVAATRWPPGAH